VAQKVLSKLGGRLRAAVSGGAALDAEISRLFIGLGLPVVQGYGLTETSPIIAGNKLENNFPDSVGQPIRDMRIKLGENDALLVKGPNVMMGYWNNEAATRDMIDGDGWLNTGDVARISETGHVYITGRLKEIIVLANGEKIPPTDMESAIAHDSLFEQVMVYGERKPYLIALLVLNPDAWTVFAKRLEIDPAQPESLTDSRVEQQVLQRVEVLIRAFPGYAKIKRVLLVTEAWSIDKGLLTPKLSLKRDKVVAKYAAEIDSLYEEH
jgi:long-chain acyl-CoA synthetase